MENKKPYQSKTILLNALIALSGVIASLGFVPGMHDFLQSHSDMMMMGLGMIGIAMRAISKGSISLSE